NVRRQHVVDLRRDRSGFPGRPPNPDGSRCFCGTRQTLLGREADADIQPPRRRRYELTRSSAKDLTILIAIDVSATKRRFLHRSRLLQLASSQNGPDNLDQPLADPIQLVVKEYRRVGITDRELD